MAYIIRDANVDDVPAIRDVRTSVRENHASVEQMEARGITSDMVRNALLADPCIWVAELDGRVVAFSMVGVEDGCVFAMFVRPEHEGRGLGRRLMEPAERFLFEHFERIWLETDGASRAAGFYRKLGWEIAERFENGDVRLQKARAA
jgi:GNAT superfamily N-acetyltransferase